MKSEIRNPKSDRNPKSEIRLRNSDFVPPRGISGFGFRTSDFHQAAFTLAEVLAALLFMAIVIPVALQGLRIASRAGEVAERKSQAARVAERILNENIVTTNWTQAIQSGSVDEGGRHYTWALHNDPWNQDNMQVLSVEVTYQVQNVPYSVRLSTLATQ